MGTHQRIAAYWDDIQGIRHNYEARAAELHKLFKENGNRRKKILDIGCGTGSLLICLARLGYECTGLDRDEDMLNRARQKSGNQGLNIRFLQGDMNRIRLSESFDGITCIQSLSLLRTRDEVRSTLQGIRNVLAPEGVFCLDVLKRPAAPPAGAPPDAPPPMSGPPPFMDIAMEKEHLKIIRINTVTMHPGTMEWGAFYFFDEKGGVTLDVQNTPLKMYTTEEIRQLLEEAGFHIRGLNIHGAGGIKLENMEICAALKK